MIKLLLFTFGYAVGSVPFAFLIAWWTGHVDLREVGSGNVGATNLFRVAGVSAGVLAAIFDIGKGVAVVLAARWLGVSPGECAAAGVAAIVGHIYPVWLGFRGGKGVATTCGVFAILAPLATLSAVIVFLVAVKLSRTVSIGSITAAICLGPFAYAAGVSMATVEAAFIAGCLVLFHHRSNLIRLAGGAEHRLGDDADEGGESP